MTPRSTAWLVPIRIEVICPFCNFALKTSMNSLDQSGHELLSNAHDQKVTAQTSYLIYISAAM